MLCLLFAVALQVSAGFGVKRMGTGMTADLFSAVVVGDRDSWTVVIEFVDPTGSDAPDKIEVVGMSTTSPKTQIWSGKWVLNVPKNGSTISAYTFSTAPMVATNGQEFYLRAREYSNNFGHIFLDVPVTYYDSDAKYFETVAPLSWKAICNSGNSFSTSVANGKFGTMCLPYPATVEGATLLRPVKYGKDTSDGRDYIWFEETGSGVAEAGRAYVYRATAGSQTWTRTSDEYSAPKSVEETNGLLGLYYAVGYLKHPDFIPDFDNKSGQDLFREKPTYFLYSSDSGQRFNAAGADIGCRPFRVCIPDLAGIKDKTVPGARYIRFGFDAETGIVDVNSEERVVAGDGKYIGRDCLIIRRNGRSYGVTGWQLN